MLIHTTQHVFSGICICGHKAEQHHGNCIARQETSDSMQSSIMFGECEHFGCNEMWKPCKKCIVGYIDRDDPLKAEKIKELRG